jgi:chitosanase
MRIGPVGAALTWAMAIVLASCSSPPRSTDPADGADDAPAVPPAQPGPSTVTLTVAQRRIADQLVSVFENGTPDPRYDYVENLGDGRGFTCGKIGFTTSSTEVRDAVEAHVAQQPRSELARHLPRLRELAATASDDTGGLAGFPDDWARAAQDRGFRQIQDALADRLTFDPAVAAARRLGIRTPLGVAILYDTAVQHGTAGDPDGMPALIARATGTVGGNPAGGVAEEQWLSAFLDVRADDLRQPSNAESQQVWSASVDRVQALRRIAAGGGYRLTPPVTVQVFGAEHELR